LNRPKVATLPPSPLLAPPGGSCRCLWVPGGGRLPSLGGQLGTSVRSRMAVEVEPWCQPPSARPRTPCAPPRNLGRSLSATFAPSVIAISFPPSLPLDLTYNQGGKPAPPPFAPKPSSLRCVCYFVYRALPRGRPQLAPRAPGMHSPGKGRMAGAQPGILLRAACPSVSGPQKHRVGNRDHLIALTSLSGNSDGRKLAAVQWPVRAGSVFGGA